MAKAELKTKENDACVETFIGGQPTAVAADCHTIIALMRKVTGEEPRMWGASIVGFGRYRYKGASGREGEWFLTGFSPRKTNLSLYILTGLEENAALLARLGKHTTGKGCLYIKSLNDVDVKMLEELVAKGVKGLEKMRVR